MPIKTKKTLSALFRALSAIGTPYVQTAFQAAQNGTKPPFPTPEGTDAKKFAADYLAYNLVRKDEVGIFASTPSQDSLIQQAVSGFLEVEQRLKYVNINGYIPGTAPTSDMLAPEVVIHTAKRKIAEALGRFKPDDMIGHAAFSGGASTRLPRKRGAPYYKYTGKPHVTRNCALLAVCAMWHSPIWREYCQARYGRESDPMTWVTIVDGSTYFTVPKTWDSLRGAALEAELNMLLQKGIGSMIRDKLKRVGIDLNDQTYNQYLAKCGSGTGSLATIDLAAASDSVSLILLDLLPHDWKRFILLTRSEKVLLPDGSWHTLQKVSSMGNGFTFELESLLFWALTSAVVELSGVEDKRIGVYGDDIICHHSCAPDVINVLAYLGFETNVDKTWVSGPFRESCGKHYFYGVDVSPFNVKGPFVDDSSVYHFLNRLRIWSYRMKAHELQDCYSYILRTLKPEKVNIVPPYFGTRAGMLIPSLDTTLVKPEPRPRKRSQTWFQGWTGWALVERSSLKKKRNHTAYVAWFNTSRGEVLVPDDEKESGRYRPRRYSTSMWPDCEIGSIEMLVPS